MGYIAFNENMHFKILKNWAESEFIWGTCPKLWPKIFSLSVDCHHGAGEDSVDKAEYEPDKMKSNQDDWTGSFHKNEKEKQRNRLTFSTKELKFSWICSVAKSFGKQN